MLLSVVPKSRIAPTPSGLLHLGNVYSFLLTAIWIKRLSGQLVLRIDDIDAERSRDEYISDIIETLDWLEIEIDEGPRTVDDFKTKFSQQLRLQKYSSAIDSLLTQGTLYACSCSRKDIQQTAESGIYPGTCRNKQLDPQNLDYSLRFNSQNTKSIAWEDLQGSLIKVDIKSELGDFVVRRKGGLPAYQIASVVDDIDLNITHIVRGEDLIHSTAAQIILANALGYNWPEDVKFLHHPLLALADGRKLSKSDGALSLAYMRSRGVNKAEIFQWFAKMTSIEFKNPTHFSDLLEGAAHKELRIGRLSEF